MDKKKKIFCGWNYGDLGPVFLGAWVWMEEHCGLPRTRSWWEDKSSVATPDVNWTQTVGSDQVLFGNPQGPNLICKQRGWKLETENCHPLLDVWQMEMKLLSAQLFPSSKKTPSWSSSWKLRTNNPFSVQNFFSKQLSCKERKIFVLSGYSTDCIFIYLSLVPHSEFIPLF